MNKIILLFILLVKSLIGLSQTGALEFSFTGESENDSTLNWSDVHIVIFYNNDTIYNQAYDGTSVVIYHLPAGKYTVRATSFYTERLLVERVFTIVAGMQTELNLNVNSYEYKRANYKSRCDSMTEIGKISKDHFIAQVIYFYGDQFDMDKNNPAQNEFGIGMNIGMTHAFLNRLSIGFKTGAFLSHAYFSSDSSLLTLQKRTFERFTYLTMPLTGHLLFTSGNQNNDDERPGFLLDIGIRYHVPILCRYVVRYGPEKIMHQNIHQFTDVRAFVGIGIYPVEFFAEYRLMDFLRSAYPEMPKLRVGMKILFGDY